VTYVGFEKDMTLITTIFEASLATHDVATPFRQFTIIS
jgi:hypothetical protein